MLLLMFKRFLRRSVSAETIENEQKLAPEQKIEQIMQGNELLREQLISDYIPYVTKVTSRFCKRYIDPSRDDEFSIALAAFNEAINQFSPESGRSFIGFAETVIRRRLIDHLRKEQRHTLSVPYSSYDMQDEEDLTYNPIETRQALQAYDLKCTADNRRLEIGEFSKELNSFGISFNDLVEGSPKHADSRKMLLGIAGELSANARLFEQLRLTGKLPVKELTDLCGVSRKTIERNRKYLIAVSFILNGKYPFLYDYLNVPLQHSSESKEAGI